MNRIIESARRLSNHVLALIEKAPAEPKGDGAEIGIRYPDDRGAVKCDDPVQPHRQPAAVSGRTILDAADEAERLLTETFDKLDPDNDRDGWFMVRLTKIREALADRGQALPGTVEEAARRDNE